MPASPALDRALLAETSQSWGLTLTPAQLDQFEAYAELLHSWNSRVNLTAISGAHDVTVRHMLDSLRCALSWGTAPQHLIDIGTGAGFPGLPLKLLQPALALTLVESVTKKADFLREVVAQLGLRAVQVLTTRAEMVGQAAAHREGYDLAVARAVADLRVLAEYCLPLCRVGGRWLAPKGAEITAELAAAQPAITQLGGRVLALETVVLPSVEPRSLLVVEKVAPTPQRYPRAAGVPARRPL